MSNDRVCKSRMDLVSSDFLDSQKDILGKMFSSGDKVSLCRGGRQVTIRPRGPADSFVIRRLICQDPTVATKHSWFSDSADFYNDKLSIRVNG